MRGWGGPVKAATGDAALQARQMLWGLYLHKQTHVYRKVLSRRPPAFCTRPSPPFHAGPHLGWKLHLHSLLLRLQLQQSQPGTLFTWITWTSQVSSSSLALSFLISKPPNYVPTWLPAWADVGRNPASQPAGHCEGAFVISVLLKRMDGVSSVRYL